MSGTSAEAVAIARLLGGDLRRTVAWVYRWETGELGLFWIGASRHVSCIDRQIDETVLAQAQSAGDLEIVAFLNALPVNEPDWSQ